MPDSYDVIKVSESTIGSQGESIKLTFNTKKGENFSLIFDVDYLARHLPFLLGMVSRARQIADAGLPPRGEPGERMVSAAAPVSGFTVHPTLPPQPVALELELGRHGLPLTLSFPRHAARQLSEELLAILSQR